MNINLTLIKNNARYIVLILIVIVVVFLIFVVSKPANTTNVIPKGVPMVNKNNFNNKVLNYNSTNFSIKYVPQNQAFGNLQGNTVYIHIKNINFANPSGVIKQEDTYISQAKAILLKYGIDPNSKKIVYTF